MDGILRISSSLSEPWTAWVMLLLLIVIALAEKFQPGLVRNSIENMFTIKERDSLFSMSSPDMRARVLLNIYQISIIALSLYTVCFVGEKFGFLVFLETAGLVTLVFGVKDAVCRLVAFVFFDSKTFNLTKRHYVYLLTAFTIYAYPVLLVVLFWHSIPVTAAWVAAIVLYAFFFVCILIKLFRLFFTDFLACFYILLYLCTLELIPLIFLLKITMWLIG